MFLPPVTEPLAELQLDQRKELYEKFPNLVEVLNILKNLKKSPVVVLVEDGTKSVVRFAALMAARLVIDPSNNIIALSKPMKANPSIKNTLNPSFQIISPEYESFNFFIGLYMSLGIANQVTKVYELSQEERKAILDTMIMEFPDFITDLYAQDEPSEVFITQELYEGVRDVPYYQNIFLGKILEILERFVPNIKNTIQIQNIIEKIPPIYVIQDLNLTDYGTGIGSVELMTNNSIFGLNNLFISMWSSRKTFEQVLMSAVKDRANIPLDSNGMPLILPKDTEDTQFATQLQEQRSRRRPL